MIEIEVDMGNLAEKLQSLGARRATRGGRRGLYQGAKVIGEEARGLAPDPADADHPYAAGAIKKGIVWQTRGVFRDASGRPTHHRAATVLRKGRAGKRNPRRYASFVEGGTNPHGAHPGTRPMPFMGPAFDRKNQAAIEVIQAITLAELDQEVERLGRS